LNKINTKYRISDAQATTEAAPLIMLSQRRLGRVHFARNKIS